MQKATFGAGCFWGVEASFKKIPGVIKTTVGYMGGNLKDPSYEDVCTNTTGHAEVVQIEFDENKLSFEELLEIFWKIHNPTQLNMQGPDVGSQYRSVIFYHNDSQRKIALKSKEELSKLNKYNNEIVTEITPAKEFYAAEEYHQNYFEKNRNLSCHN